MSKSIFDVRFAPKDMALDAECKSALTALDEWITINGAHVELNDSGEVIRGAGGKFNGGNYAQAKAARQERMQKATSSRPSYITANSTDGMKDGNGHDMPKVEIPKTLEGAKDFFGKMAEGYKEKQLESGIRRKDKFEYENNAKHYDSLRELAERREGMTPDKVKDDIDRNGTSRTVMDYIHDARQDVTGVGKWMAQDVLEKYSPYLDAKDVARYQEKIDTADEWRKG